MRIWSLTRIGINNSGVYTGIWIFLTIISLAYLLNLGWSSSKLAKGQLDTTVPKSLAELTRETDQLLVEVTRNRNLTHHTRNDILKLEQTVSDLSSRLEGIDVETAELKKLYSDINRQNETVTASFQSDTTNLKNDALSQRAQTTGSLPYNDGRNSINQINTGRTGSDNNSLKPSVSFNTKPMPSTGFEDQLTKLPQIQFADNSGTSGATQTLFGVHLAAGKSIEKLQQSWNNLRQRYPGYLADLRAQYTKENASDGNIYQLIAGPFYNILNAVKICAGINSSLDRCEQTLFVGKPLPLLEKNS